MRDERRGSAASRGYGHRWRRERAEFIKHYPLCIMCLAYDISTATTVVDHIVPHKGDPELMWAWSNWQPLCKPHHDREKQRQERSGDAGARRSDPAAPG